MKTEVVKSKSEPLKFPVIAEKDGLVVLFVNKTKGTVLLSNVSNDIGKTIGEFSKVDLSEWTILDEVVIKFTR